MAESKLQYNCPTHGIQDDGLRINLKLADGNQHTLNHCLVCLTEMLARNGVKAMTPTIIEVQVVEDFPPMDLGK